MGGMLLFPFLLTFPDVETEDKFNYLYNQYKNLMLKKAYDILKDYSLAEDATSEAYLRIYRNLHKIDDPKSNATISYMVVIVKNVAFTMLDKEKKQNSDNLDELTEQGKEPADEVVLEENLISKLSSEQIFALVNDLKEEYRSVFLLKYGQDLSHKEIASLLQISENNVTVRLHRAKTALQKKLVKEGIQ